MKFIDIFFKPPIEAMRVWNAPRTNLPDGDKPRKCLRCGKQKAPNQFSKSHRKCKACMLEIQREQQAKGKRK